MKYSRIAMVMALAASTAACATTQKIGNGVVTVVKAPIDIADAALTGTERVLNVADKAVSIAYKTRAVVAGVPGVDPLSSLNTIQAQTSAMRWALGGLDNAQRAATTVSYASNARQYVSAASQTAHQVQTVVSHAPVQRSFAQTTTQYVTSRAPQSAVQYASNASSATRSYTPAPAAASYTPAATTRSYSPPPAQSYTPPPATRTYTSNSTSSGSQTYTNTSRTYSSGTYSSRPSVTYSASGSRVKSASTTYSTYHR